MNTGTAETCTTQTRTLVDESWEVLYNDNQVWMLDHYATSAAEAWAKAVDRLKFLLSEEEKMDWLPERPMRLTGVRRCTITTTTHTTTTRGALLVPSDLE